MVWIWLNPREADEFDAENDGFDRDLGIRGIAEFSTKPINSEAQARYNSRFSKKRFQELHAPPTSTSVTVDRLWKDIILRFVSSDRVQFIPARITARGEICDDLFLLISFDRIVGIDKSRSEIRRMIENEHGTHIFSIKRLALVPNCLGKLHLARDIQKTSLLFVSDELKDALSSTGQDSCFYTVEEYNELFTWL